VEFIISELDFIRIALEKSQKELELINPELDFIRMALDTKLDFIILTQKAKLDFASIKLDIKKNMSWNAQLYHF
jgi:hypothetical protein